MKYQADATYLTGNSAGHPLLGRGGCFTRVERCASMCAGLPVITCDILLYSIDVYIYMYIAIYIAAPALTDT